MGLTSFRRAAGAALLAACLLPLHRLLDPSTTGLAGSVTRGAAEAAWSVGLWGSLLVVSVALLLGVLVRRHPAVLLAPVNRRLADIPRVPFALACAVVSLAAGAAVAAGLFGGQPTSVDSMVQLGHARALLAGRLSLPAPGDPAAWAVQNSVLADGGWISVYPPLHTAALAVAHAVGTTWLVGPVKLAFMTLFTFLALDRLHPQSGATTRWVGLLVAVSPFTVFLGSTHLSHSTAGSLAAMVLWAAVRARDGGFGWALLTGAGAGALVCTRPWTGLVLSVALVGAAWIPLAHAQPRGRRWLSRATLAVTLGAAPFAALLMAWNQSLFGHPLRLGYSVAFGPAHGLGWHTDPWGNSYGMVEALAYTGSDLVQLGVLLFESPLPSLMLPGLALLLVRRMPPGAGVAGAWAAAGLAANAAYWHHGIHFGPRFLFETAPAWVVLWVFAVVALASKESPLPAPLSRTVAWAAALSLAGGIFFAPLRAEAYRPTRETLSAVDLGAMPEEPTLIFAHGSWASRVSARLVSAGMRRDSVETALRRNDLCAVDRYARWRRAPSGPAPTIDLEPRSGTPPELQSVELSPSNRILVAPGQRPDEGCMREARSDRLGTVELEPLQWMAPPLSGATRIVARDLGPSTNEVVRAAFPGYRVMVAVDGGQRLAPRVLDYSEGMQLLWGGASGFNEGEE